METQTRLPSILHAATWALMAMLPVVFFALAVSGELTRTRLIEAFPGVVIGEGPSETGVLAAMALGLMPWMAVVFVLWQAKGLFALYRDGQALTEAAALRIRAIGIGCVFVALMQIVSYSAQVLVLSAGNPPGQRMFAVSFGLSEVGFLLAAGLMIVIGRSMAEAAEARRELGAFV